MTARRPLGRVAAVLAVDVMVAAWVVLWIVVGIVVADAANGLTQLSDAVGAAGGAVTDSGEALGSLDLPIVGQPLADAAAGIERAGQDVEATGRSTRADIERFSRLLGLAVALIPTVPMLAYYLPPRLARGREAGAFKQMVHDGDGDPRLEEFLARRAVERLSYSRLRAVSRMPWRDLDEGRFEQLAEAELRRMGFVRRSD